MSFLNYLNGQVTLDRQFELTGLAGEIGNNNQELNTSSRQLFFNYAFNKSATLTTQQVLTGAVVANSVSTTVYQTYSLAASALGSARLTSNLRSPQLVSEPVLTTMTIQATSNTGTTIQVGLADNSNGVYFSLTNNVPSIVFRRLGVNTNIPQNTWVGDKLNGSGLSGLNIIWSNPITFWIEYVPLQTVRMGIVYDGRYITCHSATYYNSATILPAQWRLPLYFFLNQTSAVASPVSLTLFDAAVYTRSLDFTSVGVQKQINLPVAGKTATTVTSLVALRLTEPANIIPIGFQVATNSNTAKSINVRLLRSPTLGGVDNSSFQSLTDSSVQSDVASTTTTFTFTEANSIAAMPLNGVLPGTINIYSFAPSGFNQIGFNYDQITERFYLIATFNTLVATVFQASLLFLEL